ncbi:hypothetical protein [Sphingomonas sp.]|uniref:hypothetical protein n=1 Tax=Sphingomonas sp. TaxID=28214 RepID=UPI003B00626D
MNFVLWLNSLDELLYELMSWLVFFPITLWRIVRHPLATMRYAEEQLLLERKRQYRETVSPPIMLILTVVAVDGLGIAIDGANPIVTSKRGLAGLVDDNTTLLLLRLVLFGLFALVLASRKVNRSAEPLNRDTLKPPFYAQCYAISPFAILVSGGTSMVSHHQLPLQVAGVGAIAAALLFYGVVEIRWLSRELSQSLPRSFLDASIGMVTSIVLTIGLGLLFH